MKKKMGKVIYKIYTTNNTQHDDNT